MEVALNCDHRCYNEVWFSYKFRLMNEIHWLPRSSLWEDKPEKTKSIVIYQPNPLLTGDDPPCFTVRVWQELEKGQVGLIFTERQRLVSQELGRAINRLVDKSQAEIPGNPLSQTSGNLSVRYIPDPSATLPWRRYENCHMIAISSTSDRLLWPLFPRHWWNFLLATLAAGDPGAGVKMKSGISPLVWPGFHFAKRLGRLSGLL